MEKKETDVTNNETAEAQQNPTQHVKPSVDNSSAVTRGSVAFTEDVVTLHFDSDKTEIKVMNFDDQSQLTAASLLKSLTACCTAHITADAVSDINGGLSDMISSFIMSNNGTKSKKKSKNGIGPLLMNLFLKYANNVSAIQKQIYGIEMPIRVTGPDNIAPVIQKELNSPQFHLGILMRKLDLSTLIMTNAATFMANSDDDDDESDEFDQYDEVSDKSVNSRSVTPDPVKQFFGGRR